MSTTHTTLNTTTPNTTPHQAYHKIDIPSPLPHHRGQLSVPPHLKTQVLNALAASGSIPRIQVGMDEVLASFLEGVAVFVEGQLEGDGSLTDEEVVGDEEMMRRIVGAMSVVGRSGDTSESGGKQGQLIISEAQVQKMVEGVRGEVEGVCRCVDGEGWVG